MTIRIPLRLADLLTKDRQLQGAINLTLHDFQIWFEDRNLTFFPEYTDHGPKHIEEVMATAEALITDGSWRLLTPEDSAVLILSTILHDCAMHLSEEGFFDLVNPLTPRLVVSEFKDKPWVELWVDFLNEASRFDGRKLRAIFGDSEPIHRPPLNAQDMTLRDRLLIGEFLRRHHPRLAHEIALWGVPGPEAEKIGLVRVPKGLDNIAGLCARSHGSSLRDCSESIPRLHRREHLKAHVPFLMAVLRIADYLQIHSERAPKQVLRVRALKSPISQGEWKAHDAVEDIHCTHDDPEAIVVVAKPTDVRTFLKLERLLLGLQDELDSSWAVLGEVYGRVQGLQDLGLTLRRVRSNLDDKPEFAKTIAYYPERVVFEADPEILKLLVDPLYGNKPSIAIRELVQNAVDACLELGDYLNKASPKRTKERFPSDASVIVHLEQALDQEGLLTVSDNGIGMTPSVVQNYFLKAGASFRRSDAWKKMHETAPGKSRVLRSGRFGIGILAAFLLGNRLEVETRHVTSSAEAGIQFSCSIEDEEIELHRVRIPRIGTTIRIRFTSEVFRSLNSAAIYDTSSGRRSWDWYHLERPSVQRKITDWVDGKKRTINLEPTNVLPNPHSNLPLGWHRIRHQDFEDIHWHYPPEGRRANEENMFCNGIKVGAWTRYSHASNEWPLSLAAPLLSIFDPDGKLPLNLERSSLTRPLPFERELADDICRDLIAHLLVHTPTESVLGSKPYETYKRISYRGLHDYNRRDKFDWFWLTPMGLSLATNWCLHEISPKNLFIFPRLADEGFAIPQEVANVYYSGLDSTLGDFDPWINFVSMGIEPTYGSLRLDWLSGTKVLGRRVMISTEYEQRVKKHKSLPKRLLSNLVEEWRDKDWLILCTADCPESNIEFRNFAKTAAPGMVSGLAEWYIDSVILKTKESVMDLIWKKTLGGPLIPFSLSTRKERFATAFEELGHHVDSHRSDSRIKRH